MNKVIHVTLDSASIQSAIRELEAYKERLRRKASELAKKLADIGAVNVSLGYARATYTGNKDVDVTVEQLSENKFRIVASGETVLILEFGAGVTYGYGHPQADEFGYGPETYPGQIHAADPRGWYIPKDKGGGHTYGNPPSMTMYLTAKELRERVQEVAREVFST